MFSEVKKLNSLYIIGMGVGI